MAGTPQQCKPITVGLYTIIRTIMITHTVQGQETTKNNKLVRNAVQSSLELTESLPGVNTIHFEEVYLKLDTGNLVKSCN